MNSALASRYGALIILLLTFYWAVETKDIEAIIAFGITLITFIGQDVYFAKRDESSRRHIIKDAKLLDELTNLIRPNIELQFLKNQDHGEGIAIERTEPISDFVYSWNNVEHEFLDAHLERLKKSAYKASAEYVSKVSLYTYSEREGLSRLNPNSRYTDEEKWEAQRKELNDLADKVVSTFEELIREGRKRL